MALSTVTINDTMEWAKRLSFNRDSGIGNSLEPALSNANMVIQTILGPPFSWWWNNEDLVFTCNKTLNTGTITNVAITGGVLTLTMTSMPRVMPVGAEFTVSGVGTATQLNGLIFEVTSATATSIVAATTLANYGSAVDTGTVTAATTQDYAVAAPNFSHIDWAGVQDINNTPANWQELTVQDRLALDSTQGRPAFVNPQSQDSDGNITFRVMPAPDQNYPIVLNIMSTAPRVASLNQTWAPLPDYLQYIYQWGFMALTWAFADDARFGTANAKFTSGILARQSGLTETERNIFLNNWNDLTGNQQQNAAQGRAARSV